MALTRRTALAAAAALPLASSLARPALAQSRIKVRIAGGGITIYGYMPFFVAQAQNMFAKHGIDAEIAQFPGGSRAMQAVLGGSSDVACGFYEHTVQIAAKGGHLVAFVLQTRNSGLVLGVRKQLADKVNTAADLKGLKIGVSAPGSATHLFAMLLMTKAGIKGTDAAAVGVGTTQTALTAFERGDVDALSLFDPIIADLERQGEIKIIGDARAAENTRRIFGGPYASGTLYGEAGWVAKNEAAVRGCAVAIQEATAFLKGASPQQAIDALGPGMCFVGMDVCTQGFTANRDAFDHDGRIQPAMADTVKRTLASFDPAIAAANVDTAATFTDKYLA